ncbi:MAG: hypothetical protein ACW96X_08290, partial [Promethearchaeota archaeon]
HTPELITPTNTARIKFICPICKSTKSLESPRSIIEKAKGLTTMSIAKGLVCEHQFQAFVDKNFIVRGYQRVDFEFEKAKTQQKQRPKKNVKDDKELFENLILEGNYLEYKPDRKKNNDKKSKKQEIQLKSEKKNKQIKELYNEFWEFIDEDNEIFQDFIKNDNRRTKIQRN